MLQSYLLGFAGLIVAALGFVFVLADCGASSDGLGAGSLIGFFGIFVGGFMRYLSKQTIRERDPARGASTPEGSEGTDEGELVFAGDRTLRSPDYQLYLVKKWRISRNEVLGVYEIEGRSFPTLEDALSDAAEMEAVSIDGE